MTLNGEMAVILCYFSDSFGANYVKLIEHIPI